MAARVIGVSMDVAQVRTLDAMAKRDGLPRSTFLASLVEREAARRKGNSVPVVVIDGERFVPARNGK